MPTSENPRRSPVPPGQGQPRPSHRGKVADIRPGEGRLVAGAALALGGIVAGHVILETARDALFLARLPPHRLAFVYLLMALLGFWVGRYDQTVARVLGRTSALILALMIGALGTTLFYVADLKAAGTFGLYLWTGFIGTVLTVQFWLFAAARFTPAQGRRLYGLIAAGGVLGAVLGGALGTLATQYFSVKLLLMLSVVLQLTTALFLTAAPMPSVSVTAGRALLMRDALATIRSSPYLVRVGAVTVAATFTVLLTDYLFKSVAAAQVAPEQLGRFLAIYYTALNAAALLVQVFIVMKVLQRAGTIAALALLPLALLLGGGATAIFGSVLSIVLITKGADGALRHSLHRVSSELLFLPLSADDRTSAKPLFDSVLGRSAQALAALTILVLTQLDLDSPRIFGVLIAGAALTWIATTVSLKGPYLDQFRRALGRPLGDSPIDVNQLNLDGVEVVLEALSSPEENRVLGAMALFEQAGRTGLIPALVLYHPSPEVLVRALELIPNTTRKDWVPLAERLLMHPAHRVRLEAVRALGQAGHWRKLDLRAFDDDEVCATACFFHADRLPEPAAHPELSALLSGERGGPLTLVALVKAIARYGDRRWSAVLERLARLGAPELDRYLPRAMARTRDTRFLPVLVRRLAYRDGRVEVRQALVALGDEGLAALSTALFDPRTDPAVVLHIPRAISRFESRRARDLLLDVLESDLPGAVRFKALRGLGRIASTTNLRFSRRRVLPFVEENAREALLSGVLAARIQEGVADAPRAAIPSGSLLVSLLEDKVRQSLERMTRLLSLIHRHEDLRRVYFALVSAQPAAMANAGELLEVLTLGNDESLRELLRALSDPLPLHERLGLVAELLDAPIETDVEAIRITLRDADPPLSALSAEYAKRRELLEVAVEVEEVVTRNTWLSASVDTNLIRSQAPV